MTESNLPALQAELARISAEAREWMDVEASDSKAVVHVGSGDPEVMREQMVEARREASRRSKELAALAAETRDAIRVEVDRQRALMEAEMRKAMEMLAPLQEQVKRMEEGIWTVNLYLGTSEEIVPLRGGEPASIDEPIALRISVLSMDEEVAAFPEDVDQEGGRDWQGMDYRDIEMFDEWVRDPKHLDQMIPERRGIVVFRPRATDYHYDDDPFANAEKNKENRKSYWLVRNGEQVYRMHTDFQVGATLMPTSQEFTRLFQARRWDYETHEYQMVDIVPGSPEWADAEKAQGGVQRHYMRVALILQGLIDRTDVFKPIHPINVMHQSAYDSGVVVIVNDAEKMLTTSRQPYYEWIRERNAELRPGMRIMGTFRGDEWEQDDIGERWQSKNARLSPMTAERPPQNTLLTIEARREMHGMKGLVVRYGRGETIFAREEVGMWGQTREVARKAKRRASAVILPSDVSVIPFDAVTESEMREYLEARTERHAYADSFPLLRAAIDAKAAERVAEAPFRDLLVRVLADDNDQDVEEVQPHIEGLVHRFKLGNRWHRALASLDQEDEAHALKMIRAEYKRIVNSGADEGRDERAVAVLREHDPEVMFIGRLSSGKYVAFAPQPRVDGPLLVHPTLWVREHTTGKTARTIATREWIVPGVRGNKMTRLYADGRWEGWDVISTENDDLTDEEFALMTTRARRIADGRMTGETLAVTYDRKARSWSIYGTCDKPRYHTSEVEKVRVQWSKKGGDVTTEVIRTDNEGIEMSYAGNPRLDRDYTRAFDRTVYLPWRKRKHRSTFSRKPDETSVDDRLLFEADQTTLDALVLSVRKAQSRVDEDRDATWVINVAQDYIEQQQIDVEVARVKAEFLAEWIDEDVWEDRRAVLTKDIKAPIEVAGDFRNEGRLHDVLRALIRAGYQEGWERLTLADAYRLTERDLPERYQPIAGLMLAPTRPQEDEEDEG